MTILLTLFISGCATTDWNTFMYGNPNGANPDNIICPNCHSVGDAQNIPLQFQTVKCFYCNREFDRAEGKRLYYSALSEQQKNMPTQITINANTGDDFSSRMRNIYQRNNPQEAGQSAFNSVNKPGSIFNPIHVKVDDR